MSAASSLVIWLSALVIVLLLVQMYADMREVEKRELRRENERLGEVVKALKNDNGILRGRLGEQPSRAEY